MRQILRNSGLAALRRPNTSAWTVNQLWWQARDDFDEVLATAKRVRKGDREAMPAYREALKEYTREKAPFAWARTQSNLGQALQLLGALRPDPARFEEAVAAYGEALKEYTREKVPLDWAVPNGPMLLRAR